MKPDFAQFLLMLVFNSLLCVGVHVATRPWSDAQGERPILWWFGSLARKLRVAKPWCDCLTCMASVWGALVFTQAYGNGTSLVWGMLYIFALAGLNSIVYNRVL